MEGLQDFLSEQISNAIKSAFKQMQKKCAILVTDDRTMEVVNSCMKVHHLNALGVGAIVNIKYERERGKWNPIYLISPSIESIKQLVNDYKNQKKLQYSGNVHLLLSSKVNPVCMELIKNSKLPRYLRTLQEIYCDFIVQESRVFHFDRPSSFGNLFYKRDYDEELEVLAMNLTSVLITLEEKPFVRFAQNSIRTSAFAQIFMQIYHQSVSSLENFKNREKRATLLILDRSQDVVAPLLHEVTYQCMINDLLECDKNSATIPGETYRQGDTETTESKLVFKSDALWEKFRHENMATAIKEMQLAFSEFKKSSAVAHAQETDDTDLVKVIRDLPKYKKMSKSFDIHHKVTRQLVKLFKQYSLTEVSEMEQTLVTGVSQMGKKVKAGKSWPQLLKLMKENMLTTETRVRLVLVYIISQGGITDKEQKQLFSAANLPRKLLNAVYGLTSLGVRIRSEAKGKQKKSPYYQEVQERALELTKSEIIQSRFEPLLALLLKKIAAGNLSNVKFPFFGKTPKAIVPSWQFKASGRSLRSSKAKPAVEKMRIVVFVLGGISYSEIRQCYLLSKDLNLDIFIGSSHLMNPNGYVELLKNLVAGSHSNGEHIEVE